MVVSEAAGQQQFGRKGKCTQWNAASGHYTVFGPDGTVLVQPQHLQLKSSKPEVKTWNWPKWSHLSKEDCTRYLAHLHCLVHSGFEPKEWYRHELIPCSEKILNLEDQHIWLVFAMLSWAIQKQGCGDFESLGIDCLDPCLGCSASAAGHVA